MRIRRNAAGFAVTWRYKGHRYMGLTPTKDRADIMAKAIRAKLTPGEVVRKAYMLAPTVSVLAAATKRNGLNGGLARAAKLTADERKRIASIGGKARWDAYRAAKAMTETEVQP